jgi:hypothetical protein
LEVDVPAGLIEDTGERLRELAGSSLVGFKFQDGPDARLVGRGALGPVPADSPPEVDRMGTTV